jgi:hypothetical protein
MACMSWTGALATMSRTAAACASCAAATDSLISNASIPPGVTRGDVSPRLTLRDLEGLRPGTPRFEVSTDGPFSDWLFSLMTGPATRAANAGLVL